MCISLSNPYPCIRQMHLFIISLYAYRCVWHTAPWWLPISFFIYGDVAQVVGVYNIACVGACYSIISDFSHSMRTYISVLVELCIYKTLSPVWYTWDCILQLSFWLPLLITACLCCLISCQLTSRLISRIVSLPNTSCDGVYWVVVCTVDHMANIVDDRIPSISKYCTLNVCKILSLV